MKDFDIVNHFVFCFRLSVRATDATVAVDNCVVKVLSILFLLFNFWTKLLHQNILEGKHYSFVGMLIITVTIG